MPGAGRRRAGGMGPPDGRPALSGVPGVFGDGLWHVAAGPDGRWLALLGWCAGAFKVGTRNAWIGWAPERRFQRLRLVAKNCRFLALVPRRVPNPASRVLPLSVRRLSEDMEERFGHPALPAETFVDPSRFRGSCCLAAGWTPAGETRGFARSRGGWVRHGRPKTVLLKPLAAGAARALGGIGEPASWGLAPPDTPEPPRPGRLRSLFDHLRQAPEFRSAPGPTAPAGKRAGHSDGWRASGGRPPSPSSRPGSTSTGWPPAGRRGQRTHVPSRLGHGSGVVAGQTASDSASGEILGARRLIRESDVAGRVLTLDALHSYPKTARLIIDRGAECVLPVKRNRGGLLDDLAAFDADFDAAPTARTLDKAHGRIEERTCALAPLDGRPNDLAPLPGRRQAFRIVRRRTVIRTGKTTAEAVRGLTSPGPDRANPAEIPALNRGRWEIGNRLHYVRDFSCDEDRSRMRSRALPQNLACLANAAISIVRLRRRFRQLPQARWHCAARQGEALRKVVRPA